MCLGVPGELLSAHGEGLQRTGKVDFSGVTREVSLAYVPEAVPGDHVLVHVGFAISVIDAAEAARTLDYLRQMNADDATPDPV